MSLTGSYVWDNELQKMVKVSSRVPRTIGGATSDVCSGVKEPYWEEHLGPDPIYVRSRAHKAKLLKERGLTEKSAVRGGLNEF